MKLCHGVRVTSVYFLFTGKVVPIPASCKLLVCKEILLLKKLVSVWNINSLNIVKAFTCASV